MTKRILLIITSFFIISAAVAQNAFQHPSGKYVIVNGAKLWVEIEGTGDPLFLIAGGPGNSHVYMHSFDALKDSFTLVFIDNFGRGKSDTAKNVTEYSTKRDVEDVEGIRVALGYDKINLLGHSYGSEVAQLYAIKYGAHLKHLVIADGFFNGAMWQENDDNCNREFAEQEPELWDSLMMLRNKGLRSADPEHYKFYGKSPGGLLYFYNPDNAGKLPGDKTYPNDFNTKLYYQLVGPDGDFVVGNDIAKFDVIKQLKDLKMPVLIIAGRYDRISAPKFSVQYKKYCPQAKFIMFEHSGHSPMVEEPMKEITAIKLFLSK